MTAWDEKFGEIVEQLNDVEDSGVGISIATINHLIWRLADTSLHLSRFVQYWLLDQTISFPDEVQQVLSPLAALCTQVSDYLWAATEQQECLECLEEQTLGVAYREDQDE